MTTTVRSPRHRRGRSRLGGLLIIGAMAATYLAGVVGHETATAATGLKVVPASGSTNGTPMALEIPAPCPGAADSFIVEASGAGFPAGSFMIGLTELQPEQTTFNAGGDWKAIAGNNQGTLPLNGAATLHFYCLTGQEPAGADYETTVTFTPTAGTDSDFEVAAGEPTPTPTGAGPMPTPTPVGATPTPTPGGATATPTPTSTPTTTPTATPDPEDPTPTPEPDSEVDTDGNGSGTGTGNGSGDGDTGGLPGAGGKDPSPLILLAAMLGAVGISLLLLESASRLGGDPQ